MAFCRFLVWPWTALQFFNDPAASLYYTLFYTDQTLSNLHPLPRAMVWSNLIACYLCRYYFLDPGMRLGEGTGGALSMSIMEGAVSMFKEVLTFEEAGVAGKE